MVGQTSMSAGWEYLGLAELQLNANPVRRITFNHAGRFHTSSNSPAVCYALLALTSHRRVEMEQSELISLRRYLRFHAQAEMTWLNIRMKQVKKKIPTAKFNLYVS